MELITILLSGLLAFVSPAGLVIDSVAEGAIRSRFDKVEQLQVRVDNAPSYQVAQGKVDRVRLAGRGLWLTPEVRIDQLEVETDPVALDLKRLRQSGEKQPKGKKRSLTDTIAGISKDPVQGAVHLVITEKDINQALKSPKVAQRLQERLASSLGSAAAFLPENYQILNPRVDFLADNRLRFQVDLQGQENTDKLAVNIESGLGVVSGRQLQLIAPVVTVNGNPVPPQFVSALTSGASSRLDLRNLEDTGIIARLLQFKIDSDRLEVAAFVRLQPPNTSK